ncbi:MAG: VOC family protein [Acidimicrobiales bacterium]
MSKAYFVLVVADMDRALAFWKDLGLDPAMVSPEWSELRWGEATLALHGGGDGVGGDTGLGFEVTDLDDAVAQVETAGGTVVERPSARPGEGIRLATVADPEGNRFFLAESA